MTLFNLANNKKDLNAYKLDFKCARNQHSNYENCLYVSEQFSSSPTLVSVLLQPLYNFITSLLTEGNK